MNKTTSAGFPPRLAVTYRLVGDLIPDPRNARTHPKRQIDQIRASIEAFVPTRGHLYVIDVAFAQVRPSP